ncbi:MAG TPA: DUF192 domain-containing protein [Candidatus Nanoarchaeia archaeon]|nr:DUF192 domain-containing protein [Candidatus Nanoarchaeia archaeon]
MAGLRNLRSGERIVAKCRFCASVWSKALGLMFSRRKPGLGLIFIFRRPIKAALHMLFVFYSLDVLFLDANRRIIEIKQDFRPFSFYTPEKAAVFVIELTAGKAARCRIGDRLEF